MNHVYIILPFFITFHLKSEKNAYDWGNISKFNENDDTTVEILQLIWMIRYTNFFYMIKKILKLLAKKE